VNLQIAPMPLEEAPADDAIARVLADAKIGTEGELLDALEHRRTLINLSLASLDHLSGLTTGHSSKCLSPARTKSPTTGTLFALLDSLALSVVLVVDGAKLERVGSQWMPRHEEWVRRRALSPTALQRARPVILAELARKAARARWAGVDARTFVKAMAGEECSP
jgi:hypothetical protein